jgi:hypothetical protein
MKNTVVGVDAIMGLGFKLIVEVFLFSYAGFFIKNPKGVQLVFPVCDPFEI